MCFKFRHTCLRAWRGRLFWDDTPSPPSDFVLPLKAAEARLPLEELGGTLMLSRTRGKGLSTAKIADGLLLRLRQGGERLSIIGRPRRAVADLLREGRNYAMATNVITVVICPRAFGGGAGHCNGGRFCRRSG